MNSPIRISSPSGLAFEINANGSIRRMDHGEIMLGLFLGNEMEGGLTRIHLRRLSGSVVESIPLFGPGTPASQEANEHGFFASGVWGDLFFRVQLALASAAPAWFWHVEVENRGAAEVTCDLIYCQDMGLAHYGAIRLNEFYVSQYVDHTPLEHPKCGHAVASRQNQPMGGRHPWTVIGSLRSAVSFGTDALQFHGLTGRTGEMAPGLSAGLPGKRLQHEHSMVSIQDAAMPLRPGERMQGGFFGCFVADKPTATSEADLSWIGKTLALPEAVPCAWPSMENAATPAPNLFGSAPVLESLDLTDAEISSLFGKERRHAERRDGKLLSFFAGSQSHVVLGAKERQVLRPHGTLLRTGGALTPDESALASTLWMNGVFHSMLTQGHVSINRFLSTCHSYLGLFRSHGQRIFVERDGTWRLLGIPSAFEMAPDRCRWIYRFHGGCIEVTSAASDDRHALHLEISVEAGPPARFLISHHVAINGDDGSGFTPVRWESSGDGVVIRPVPDCDVGWRFPNGGFLITPRSGTPIEAVGGDELLFADGRTRQQPFLCFLTSPCRAAGLVIEGRLVESVATTDGPGKGIDSALQINVPEGSPLAAAAGRMGEIFPWFIHNALVHYLSPRGLEQYSGGGWGTRDVCQGPMELLLALGRFEPIRDLLRRVFRQQNPDGDWPQWFMFFERERNIRPGDSHGDIVFWPVVALSQYLSATGDAAILEERLPFFHPEGDAAAENGTVWQHVDRALNLIRNRTISGTRLAAYGHGDWNDSLQPARPEMRERLCSAWTVTLNYQAFMALADAMQRLGHRDRADEMRTQAAAILEEFQRVLIVDDVVCGLAYFHENGSTDFLLHPQDTTTGLSYSLLPMIHAIINDMFTPEQAKAHLQLIRLHLTGPDGARLFDRPLAYHGGLQTHFQRAETASFFGREIGIMYTHAHLRYCEALARFGDAAALFEALCRVNPISLGEIVPSATLRQANCYFSSSDAAFTDRYAAFSDYHKVNSGEIALEGGWRIYSSGAGICTRLIMQCFLGIRIEKAALVLDPVIPTALHGMTACIQLLGSSVEVAYSIGTHGCGPVAVTLNGAALAFSREANAYRTGGVRVCMEEIAKRLTGGDDRLEIVLG